MATKSQHTKAIEENALDKSLDNSKARTAVTLADAMRNAVRRGEANNTNYVRHPKNHDNIIGAGGDFDYDGEDGKTYRLGLKPTYGDDGNITYKYYHGVNDGGLGDEISERDAAEIYRKTGSYKNRYTDDSRGIPFNFDSGEYISDYYGGKYYYGGEGYDADEETPATPSTAQAAPVDAKTKKLQDIAAYRKNNRENA